MQEIRPLPESYKLYCERCQTAYREERCPVCGRRKGRPARPEDICLLTETDGLQVGILEDLLRQEGIPAVEKSTLGAGLAMQAGILFERIRFYVRCEHLERAKEILETV